MRSVVFFSLVFLYSNVGVVHAAPDAQQPELMCSESPKVKYFPVSSCAEKNASQEKMNSETQFPQFCFLEFRGAYFLSTSHSLREIYSPAALCGLEFDCHLYKQLYAWVGAGYLKRRGTSRPTNTTTTLTLVPINAGMKWIYTMYRVQPYLGVGAEATYGHEKVRNPPDTSIFIPSRSDWAWGGIFKIGFLVYFVDHLFLDFYTDYSLRTLNLKKLSSSSPHLEFVNSVNLSGFSFGAGLGYGF